MEGEPAGESSSESSGFTVRLANFTGPFDLLLQLIGKHKLDVTEVALHQVTDEFIAYIRAMGDQWDLDEASEFLLIAATLLDLKAARLLPAAEVEDEEDLALLEARDLLFARLLQYKAFKEAAAHIADLEAVGGRRYPRAVSLEPRYAEALPELVLGIGAERLRALVIRAMTPKPTPEVSIAHVHMVRVSVREHAAIISDRLRRAGTATFSTLCADCEATLEVVARFLALLELYREGLVTFVQEQALDELTVRWTGPADGGPDLQIDEYAGTPADPGAPAAAPADPGAPAAVPAEPGAAFAESGAPGAASAESGAHGAAPNEPGGQGATPVEFGAQGGPPAGPGGQGAAAAEPGTNGAAPTGRGDAAAAPTGSRDVGTSED
ncbi:ScpA family protein [Micromonospora sp. 15K316]|uniref:segregation and condensation protein A n=1 Tax=Micromonospora sp. 15K316 TaxID=2530376 RepID=UPI001FB5DE99|nr:ScpA family protein [Micromonospora sp. 15K316]